MSNFVLSSAALLFGLTVSCTAQSRTHRVELDNKVYEVQFLQGVSSCASPYSGNNRNCVPRLREGQDKVWAKVVQLNRTPTRQWGPDVDSWSMGILKVLAYEEPIDVVRSVLRQSGGQSDK